jgi:hypothetical protein
MGSNAKYKDLITTLKSAINALDPFSKFNQCHDMNQVTLLRESRSKHTLRSYDAAAKQLRVFKMVLPISEKNAKSSKHTHGKRTVTLNIRRKS